MMTTDNHPADHAPASPTARCQACNGEGGEEVAASSTNYFWKPCPVCTGSAGATETTTVSLDEVKERLKAEGYGGLYYPGECGCGLDDLAPCGQCEKDRDEDWINGCEAGYKHVDPRSAFGDWVLSGSKEQPTPDEFDRAFANC